MNPTPSTTPQMDNDVINLAKAIRQTESGGNFNAKGASGEHGAYQWTPNTWKAHAQQVLGDANAEMTPSNQNAVAYTVLKSWKDKGLNPAQIAAKWNSGSETGWENKVGTNSMGVHYDVPKYVKSVTDAYQQVKQGGTPPADPNNPSSTAATPQQPEESLGSKLWGVAKDIASPVATMIARVPQAGAALAGVSNEDIDKWTEANMGKIGLDGLIAPTPKNFSDLPKDIGRGIETVGFGVGGPAKAGATLGLGYSMEQGNPILSGDTALNVAGGAVGGKLLDVAGKVASPLVGALATKTGLMPGGVLEKSYQAAKGKVAKAYEDSLPLTSSQRAKEANLLAKKGDNVYTTLAEHGVTPGSPEARAQLQDISDRYANGVAQAQKEEFQHFSLPELKSEIDKGVNERINDPSARLAAKQKIEKAITDLIAENPNALQKGPKGEQMVPSDFMERLRTTGNEWTPFNASDPGRVGQSTGYALSNAVRDLVESKGTFPAYRDANREWGKIIHAREILDKIEGSGKDFRKLGGLSGQVAQKVLSGALGYHSGGIMGALLGEMTADAAGRVIANPKYKTYLSRQIIKNFHGRTPSKSALAKLAKQVEQHIQERESRLALPASKTIFAGKATERGLTPREVEANKFTQNSRIQNTRLALPPGNPVNVPGPVRTLVSPTKIESPAKTVRSDTGSLNAKLQAVKKKQEIGYQPTAYTPEQVHFKEAEHKVLAKLSELSQAGYRRPTENGNFVGVSSTFPTWVPEHLRKTKYFTQAVKAYESGEYPRSGKANELLAIIKKQIDKEAARNAQTASHEAIAYEKSL